jgi:hypothetical protein
MEGTRQREWIALAAAVSLGPLFLLIGYQLGLVFGAAGAAYFLVCILFVPLFVIAAGRRKVLVWQVAILSLTLTNIADSIRLNAIHKSEIYSEFYVFWALGTLLSLPVPVYFTLKPLARLYRYVACVLIGAIAVALWLGIKHFSG